MNNDIDALLTEFHGNSGTVPAELDSVESEWGIKLPDDYRRFLVKMNGGEGFIGRQYLVLWKAEELVPFNQDYEVTKYVPGIFLFGSSGGGEGFGFDSRNANLHIVQVPFIGLDADDAVKVADSFSELLQRMHVSHGSLL